jgi:hypothetical protein
MAAAGPLFVLHGQPDRPGRGLGVAEQELRHLGRRENVVHETRGDRARGHAVVLGVLGVLGEHEPAFSLHGPEPDRAFRTRAGQDHADRPVALVLSQGAEKEIDGMPDAALFHRRFELQDAVADRKVLVRRDDVHLVRLDDGPARHLGNLHCRVPLEKIGHQALVFGREMGDEHEGHAAVGRHLSEELFERLEPAGRGADPHYVGRRARGPRGPLVNGRRNRWNVVLPGRNQFFSFSYSFFLSLFSRSSFLLCSFLFRRHGLPPLVDVSKSTLSTPRSRHA